MFAASSSVSPQDLWSLIGIAQALQIIDVRPRDHYDAAAGVLPGADTARPDLAPEAAGLHAISLRLSALAGDDDHGLLRHGFMVYDALFAWLRFAVQERHNWPAKAA